MKPLRLRDPSHLQGGVSRAAFKKVGKYFKIQQLLSQTRTVITNKGIIHIVLVSFVTQNKFPKLTCLSRHDKNVQCRVKNLQSKYYYKL